MITRFRFGLNLLRCGGWAAALLILPVLIRAQEPQASFRSIDTGLTITKVRSAQQEGRALIVAASYEGTVLAFTYEGQELWRNPLSGFMVRDLWCEDLDGDGRDEVLAANAGGRLYCLDDRGELLWSFQPSSAPMNAVSVIRAKGATYVVCGGYDTNIYYLTIDGKLEKTLASSDYSKLKPWGKLGEKRLPPKWRHIANFIRPVRGPDGTEVLAIHGTHESNAVQGALYLFKPLANKPFHSISKFMGGGPFGDFSVSDINQDGVDEITLGGSGMIDKAEIVRVDLQDYGQTLLAPKTLKKKVDRFGYRVAQSVVIGEGDDALVFTSFGSQLLLSPLDLDYKRVEALPVGYSFNDLWKDERTGMLLLGSLQSGGSCIHILDPAAKGWKAAVASFEPTGKMKEVLENTVMARKQLADFEVSVDQRSSRPVYMMTESLAGDVEKLARGLEAEYGTPIFLNGAHTGHAEVWDRSEIENEKYRERKDRRRNYDFSQKDALDFFLPLYKGEAQGASYWGGHGNDPYMFSTDTMRKVVDGAKGKKSVMIYPELEAFDENFQSVLDNHFYPLAEHFADRNAMIYVRTKHAFWQSIVYEPLWARLISGEFPDVFIPAMEETTDKSMEQSIAARVGIWASGATNQWGARGARDNPSFDRMRQFSHQMVPNHFLRALIYNVSYGATYLDNFAVDQEYFSLLYELIAKGALFVPEADQIVSFSPVHLSMTRPDPLYLDEGNNVKWLTFFDEKFEKENPRVFSRLNGTWPGAPVTDWDFSRYAAGVKDRRLNFLPPYENGLVLITPPQAGVFSDASAPRGSLEDRMHPLYRGILKEYVTDGRDYLSADGKKRYRADEYYKEVETDIGILKNKLPLSVTGGVAWVVAQTAPTHLRLTLIDSGYINPKARTARVQFHAVEPKVMTELLSGDRIDLSDPASIEIEVPSGLFKFIDIELTEPL